MFKPSSIPRLPSSDLKDPSPFLGRSHSKKDQEELLFAQPFYSMLFNSFFQCPPLHRLSYSIPNTTVVYKCFFVYSKISSNSLNSGPNFLRSLTGNRSLGAQFSRICPQTVLSPLVLMPSSSILSEIQAVSKQRQNKRIIFHYIGPSFDQNRELNSTFLTTPSEQRVSEHLYHTQIEIKDIFNALVNGPTLYVFDKPYSGSLEMPIFSLHARRIYQKGSCPDVIAFFSSQISEVAPNPQCFPDDFFTAILTHPARIAIEWHAIRLSYVSGVSIPDHCFANDAIFSQYDSEEKLYSDVFCSDDKINQQVEDEINSTLTAVVETMCLSTFTSVTFLKFFRTDTAVAAYTVGFFLAQRIFAFFNVHPISFPELPSLNFRQEWQTLDLELDSIITQLQSYKKNQMKTKDSFSSNSKSLSEKENLSNSNKFDHNRYSRFEKIHDQNYSHTLYSQDFDKLLANVKIGRILNFDDSISQNYSIQTNYDLKPKTNEKCEFQSLHISFLFNALKSLQNAEENHFEPEAIYLELSFLPELLRNEKTAEKAADILAVFLDSSIDAINIALYFPIIDSLWNLVSSGKITHSILISIIKFISFMPDIRDKLLDKPPAEITQIKALLNYICPVPQAPQPPNRNKKNKNSLMAKLMAQNPLNINSKKNEVSFETKPQVSTENCNLDVLILLTLLVNPTGNGPPPFHILFPKEEDVLLINPNNLKSKQLIWALHFYSAVIPSISKVVILKEIISRLSLLFETDLNPEEKMALVHTISAFLYQSGGLTKHMNYWNDMKVKEEIQKSVVELSVNYIDSISPLLRHQIVLNISKYAALIGEDFKTSEETTFVNLRNALTKLSTDPNDCVQEAANEANDFIGKSSNNLSSPIKDENDYLIAVYSKELLTNLSTSHENIHIKSKGKCHTLYEFLTPKWNEKNIFRTPFKITSNLLSVYNQKDQSNILLFGDNGGCLNIKDWNINLNKLNSIPLSQSKIIDIAWCNYHSLSISLDDNGVIYCNGSSFQLLNSANSIALDQWSLKLFSFEKKCNNAISVYDLSYDKPSQSINLQSSNENSNGIRHVQPLSTFSDYISVCADSFMIYDLRDTREPIINADLNLDEGRVGAFGSLEIDPNIPSFGIASVKSTVSYLDSRYPTGIRTYFCPVSTMHRSPTCCFSLHKPSATAGIGFEDSVYTIHLMTGKQASLTPLGIKGFEKSLNPKSIAFLNDGHQIAISNYDLDHDATVLLISSPN